MTLNHFEGHSLNPYCQAFKCDFLLRPRERLRSTVMSTSVCACVCVSVCLFVREHISGTTRAIFTNFIVHVAYDRGSVLHGRVTKIQEERAILGVFFPVDNALHSIVFGTRTKTVKPIKMPFAMMTRVGSRYHVLDGGPDPPRGGATFWGKRRGRLKRNGTLYRQVCRNGLTDRDAVLDEESGGPKEPCFRWVQISQEEEKLFGDCPGHSKALAVLAVAVAAAFDAKGIIQSPITSCSRRDNSVCQANANSILKIYGRSRCGLSAAKQVVGLQSAGEV